MATGKGQDVSAGGSIKSGPSNPCDVHNVVDVDYRQEFIVSNSDLNKVSTINYLISLQTVKSGQSGSEHQKELTSIDFTCNVQDLQDLVSKMKEISKGIENVTK